MQTIKLLTKKRVEGVNTLTNIYEQKEEYHDLPTPITPQRNDPPKDFPRPNFWEKRTWDISSDMGDSESTQLSTAISFYMRNRCQ